MGNTITDKDEEVLLQLYRALLAAKWKGQLSNELSDAFDELHELLCIHCIIEG